MLVAAIYWPGLHGAFFFDDGPSILLSEGVRLDALSLEALRQTILSGGAGPTGRPLSQLSFALNYYFSGFDPFAFKATNLAIHLACGLVVLRLLLRLLGAAVPAATARHTVMAAGAATIFWLLHPIQLLPVLHVVQRMTSLSALFLLAAFLSHVHGRERGDRAGAVWVVAAWTILWPLSVLSKENGILFPAFVLAWELILRARSVGKLDRFALALTGLAGIVFFLGLAYAVSPLAQWLWSGYGLRPFSLSERLMTEGRVIWLYIGLIMAPRLDALGLYHDDIVISTHLWAPWTTFPAMVGLASLVWLAWWVRQRAPLVTFGIAWFLIGHAVESTALPLELAHEHRNYLPLLGFAMAGGWGVVRVLQSKAPYRTVGIALVGTAAMYFTFVTALRAHQFGDEVRRSQIEARNHPASARAQHEAGLVLAALPEAAVVNSLTLTSARHHFEMAGALDPNFKMSWLGLIHLHCQAATPVARADVNELARRLRETPFAPGDRTVLYELKEMSVAGSICLGRTDVDALFDAALGNPGVSPSVRAMLHSWHADYLWLHERDMAAARDALTQSLALNRSNASNRLKWAQLLLISGEKAEARHRLLELKSENLAAEERRTLDASLAALNMATR